MKNGDTQNLKELQDRYPIDTQNFFGYTQTLFWVYTQFGFGYTQDLLWVSTTIYWVSIREFSLVHVRFFFRPARRLSKDRGWEEGSSPCSMSAQRGGDPEKGR